MGADATASYIQDSADTDSALSISTTRVGIGTDNPDGTLHVHVASAGSITPMTDADDFVLENSTAGGMSILYPDANYGMIRFGSPTDNNNGAIFSDYNSGNQTMHFQVDGTQILTMLDTGNVGIGDTDPSEAKLSITGVASGDAGIKIDQDQNNYALEIDSEATTTSTIMIQAAQNTTAPVINIDDADQLTTAGGLQIKSNSADNSSRNLIRIINEHASADNTVGLLIQQDGADAHIEFSGDGNGGIKFGKNCESSDVKTLDDYEEGYFTGALTCVTSGTITVNSSYDQLAYTKIGRVVHVQGFLTTASVSSPVGNVTLTGLPFTSANLTEVAGKAAVSATVNGLASGNTADVLGEISEGATQINLYFGDASSWVSDLSESWQANTDIRISATYIAA